MGLFDDLAKQVISNEQVVKIGLERITSDPGGMLKAAAEVAREGLSTAEVSGPITNLLSKFTPELLDKLLQTGGNAGGLSSQARPPEEPLWEGPVDPAPVQQPEGAPLREEPLWDGPDANPSPESKPPLRDEPLW